MGHTDITVTGDTPNKVAAPARKLIRQINLGATLEEGDDPIEILDAVKNLGVKVNNFSFSEYQGYDGELY